MIIPDGLRAFLAGAALFVGLAWSGIPLPSYASLIERCSRLLWLGFLGLGLWRPRLCWSGWLGAAAVMVASDCAGERPSLIRAPAYLILVTLLATWPALVLGGAGAGLRVAWEKVSAKRRQSRP